MRTIRRTAQFKRDVRRLKRRGKDFGKLKWVIGLLLTESALPGRPRDHQLTGPWKGIRDVHIEPDWLLLYQLTGQELVLIRTGTHAGLF